MTTKTSEDWLAELEGPGPAGYPVDSKPTSSPELPTPAFSLASYKREQVIELARVDLDFFALLTLGEVVTHKYPPVFLAVWQLLTTSTTLENLKKFLKICLGLPRGVGKTTLMKLIMAWCVIYSKLNFPLIVCSTATLAENFLADVMDMLSTENIRRLFGDYRIGLEKDTQQLKKFGFRGRNIILAAMGANSSLRGLNLKNKRPDFILMDDIQTKECADSPQLSETLLTWMLGTLMKTKPHTGCLYLYTGNMYQGEGCILRKLKNNPVWVSFVCGGILADGNSIWPELVSVDQYLEEFANDSAMGHPEIFLTEVQNDEDVRVNNNIDVSKIPACAEAIANGEIPHQGSIILIDPASGKLAGNDVAIGLFLLYDGVPFLARLEAGKFSPGETIQKALQLALSFGCRLIVVESVAYQYTLLYWFNFICESLSIEGISLQELPVQEFSKNAGIAQALQALVAGEIRLYPVVRAAVIHQIVRWNKLKRDNEDDILDLLRMVSSAIAAFGQDMISDAPATRTSDAARTLSMTEMFSQQYSLGLPLEGRYN